MTEKSGAIAPCKILDIPVNKVFDEKIIIGKRGLRRRRRTRGR
jgi:hypothetical protein